MLRWVSTHDALPDLYADVIVCYRFANGGTKTWLVGAGHRHEDGWKIETETDEWEEEYGRPIVCAWMEWPELPRCAVLHPTHHYRDWTQPWRGE